MRVLDLNRIPPKHTAIGKKVQIPKEIQTPVCRRESLAKKPYSAILNLFKPFKTLLNGFKSRPDSRLKLLSVTYEVTRVFLRVGLDPQVTFILLYLRGECQTSWPLRCGRKRLSVPLKKNGDQQARQGQLQNDVFSCFLLGVPMLFEVAVLVIEL